VVDIPIAILLVDTLGWLPNTSWQVVRSRGSTLRSKARPLGRKDSVAVAQGNVLANRSFILLLFASAKAIWWLLEQPGTSLMEYMPLFQKLLRMVGIRRSSINMSDFGGPTKKRTLLYSRALTSFWNLKCFDKRFDLLLWFKVWRFRG